ncbi:MAG: MlaD family protein [Alphaproteobacteria bacterium]
MENKAHYALIGTFVLLATLAVVAFIAWKSNSQWDQQFDNYEVVFTGPVKGLTRGSEVQYNGLRVGEVTRLAWDRDDSNTIIANIQVVDNTPVHVDSMAQLEPQGLTGLNYIQITSGASGEMFSGREPYQLQGRMSQLDTFLEGGGSVIEATQNALARVSATLNEDGINDFHKILRNLNEITTKINNADLDGETLKRVLLSFETAAAAVTQAAEATDQAAVSFDNLVKGDVTRVLARAESSLDNVDTMMLGITEFAAGGTALTADGRDAINRLSNSGLTDLEETADGIRRLINSLNELVEKLDENPAAFLAGEERETMELPQ